MTKPTGNPRGRPRGSKNLPANAADSSIMKEFRARILRNPKSAKVMEAIFNAALDDNHRHQAAAWKLLVDRIAPISGFDTAVGSGTRTAIQVNITGVPGVNIEEDGDIIEHE